MRLVLVAVGAIVAMFIGGCGGEDVVAGPSSSTPTAVETEPTAAPTPTSESAPPSDPTPIATETPEPAPEPTPTVVPAPPVFAAAAAPVPTTDLGPSEPLVPGAYRVDTIGVPLSFVAPEVPAILVYRIEPETGAVTLGAITTGGGSDRVITIDRPVALNAPDQLRDEPTSGGGWPTSDIEPWLDALVDAEVAERDRVDVGGFPAIRFRLVLGDGAVCSDAPFCQHFGFDTSETATTETLVWWVMPPDRDPVRISAQVLDATDADAWFGTAAAIVESVGFGVVGAGPEDAGPDGPCGDLLAQGVVTIGVAGGLSFDLGDEERFVVQPVPCGLAVVYGQDPNQQINIMVAGSGPAGEALASADDVVEVLASQGVDLSEQPAIEVAGLPTRVFDIGGEDARPADPALAWYAIAAGADPGDPAQTGWDAPQVGRLWLLESDRGVIMVTAAAFGLGTAGPDIVVEAEALIATLELL
jgi:hypothetical protein